MSTLQDKQYTERGIIVDIMTTGAPVDKYSNDLVGVIRLSERSRRRLFRIAQLVRHVYQCDPCIHSIGADSGDLLVISPSDVVSILGEEWHGRQMALAKLIYLHPSELKLLEGASHELDWVSVQVDHNGIASWEFRLDDMTSRPMLTQRIELQLFDDAEEMRKE